MTSSMTAFSRSEADLGESQLTWELRTVNHRYLDINLRLPEEFRFLETDCRGAISAMISRGRVDAQFKLDKSNNQGNSFNLDPVVLDNLGKAVNEIESRYPGLQPARSLDILRWPGVIVESPFDADSIRGHSLETLNVALQLLVDNRTREGHEMSEVIRERASRCRDIVAKMNNNMPTIQQKAQDRVLGKIRDLGIDLDPERMAQEVVLMMTKSDVSEELDRIKTHLDEVIRLLEASKPVGRSLDFVMQELNREANTLGSKSVDSEMTAASIDLKVLIEQMREQVQNIE